nr:acylphosphatase [Rothia sp. ZJ1223]
MNATVSGKVQGVGFRWWTAGEAKNLKLVGYAKNLDNGDVEVVAQGARESCQQLLDVLQSGDTAGHVESVTADISQPTGTFKGFGTY